MRSSGLFSLPWREHIHFLLSYPTFPSLCSRKAANCSWRFAPFISFPFDHCAKFVPAKVDASLWGENWMERGTRVPIILFILRIRSSVDAKKFCQLKNKFRRALSAVMSPTGCFRSKKKKMSVDFTSSSNMKYKILECMKRISNENQRKGIYYGLCLLHRFDFSCNKVTTEFLKVCCNCT